MKRKTTKKNNWKKYKNEKEPPSCSIPKVQQYRANREQFLEKNIPPYVKKKGDIIYGARALNKQLPPDLQRPTDDYDIWSKQPKDHCDKLEDHLDKCVGCDMFTEEQLEVGKGKKVYRIRVNPTGKQEVDYSKPPTDFKYKVIGGVKYQDIKHQEKRLKEMSKDPKLAFRAHKTKRDLGLIEKAKKKEKKKNKLEESGFEVMNPFW